MSTTKSKAVKQDQKDHQPQQQKNQQQKTRLTQGPKQIQKASAILEHELPEMRMTD